jgi:hypothetical protein
MNPEEVCLYADLVSRVATCESQLAQVWDYLRQMEQPQAQQVQQAQGKTFGQKAVEYLRERKARGDI